MIPDLDARLSGIIAGCREREAGRYEVDGLRLAPCVETVYRAALIAKAEAEILRRLQFGLVGTEMARVMVRPAPLQASA